MSKTLAQIPNLDGMVKPGELIEVRPSTDLSLHARRLFNVLIENAWPEITEDKSHRVEMHKLRGRHKGEQWVADSLRQLMTTIVEVPTKIEGHAGAYETTLLVETIRTLDENNDKAVVIFTFSKGMREIISKSNYWGRIKGYVCFSFSSKYAISLYEALCLRGNLRVNEQRFSVEDFRGLLGVPEGKLKGFPQLKQSALDPAVLEVNALSDFTVEISPIREGGRIRGKLIGFLMRWEKKPREEWLEVLDELGRHKAGRKARITGRVEKVA
ncbi:MAG: replication initiation protein [Geminicoccaceae bacterium]